MDKRQFITGGLAVGAASLLANSVSTAGILKSDGAFGKDGKYSLPKLPYAYDALEPYIDRQTMELHHDKHHAGYVRGLNNAIEKVSNAINSKDFSLIKHWEGEIAFHGAGHFLHTIFWNNMGPSQGKRSEKLEMMLKQSFGSYNNFMNLFIEASSKVEGSGWGILAYEPIGKRLLVLQAEKHQNRSPWAAIPILVIDVWEHAYYLKYQNKRKDYVKAFFNIINWDDVSERLEWAMK